MSHTHYTASSPANFQLIIDNALDTYKKRTKNDLLAHPLATRFQTCNSPGAIIAVLQEQVQGLDQSKSSNERWTKWLDPTVNVLQAFSSILEAGASMVCFRAFVRVLRTYIHVTGITTCEYNLCRGRHPPFSEYPQYLLPVGLCNTYSFQTAKDMRAREDTLVDIFERIERFFRRLGVYTEAQPTSEMMDMIAQIMVQVVSILGIATREIKQSRLSKYSLYQYITVH